MTQISLRDASHAPCRTYPVFFLGDIRFLLATNSTTSYLLFPMIPLETLSHDSFAPLLGRPFTLTTGTGPVELQLCAVDKLGHRHPSAARDPFSIRFRSTTELHLPQGMYLFSCEELGEMEIFITQIAGGTRDSEFEAVFT